MDLGVELRDAAVVRVAQCFKIHRKSLRNCRGGPATVLLYSRDEQRQNLPQEHSIEGTQHS